MAKAQDRAKAAQYTLEFIAHGGFGKPWLLVYDNVDDPRVLQAWGPKGNAHVLVTSRISNWSMGVAPIEVDAWALAEATAFLVKETGRTDLPEASLNELAEALGRLPLALAHAAAYLRRRKAVTVTDYIADLDRHMSGLPKDAEYRSPVYATYSAALAQAEAEAPGATALMSLAAFFAPEDIAEELFAQDPKLYPAELVTVVVKRERLADTLGVLDDLSLIDFEPETRTFSTHRIVQAAARDTLASNKDAWAQRAVSIAFAAFPEPAQETWPQCARLVSHVRALHTHVPAEATTRELGWLLGAAGEYSHERAALADVLPLFNASLAIAERLAKADPGNAGWQRDLSVSNERVGDLYAQTGSVDEAREAFQRALGVYEGLIARNPGDIPSQVFSVVPRWRLSRLDPARARQHLEAALSILKPLAASGRLDANRRRWIDQMEAELAEL